MRKIYACLALACMTFAGATLLAQPQQISLTLFDGGYTEPLYLTHAGDARIFVVEKDGLIKIVDQQGNVNPTPYLNINSRVGSGGSEQGLLGLAFHPKYKENGYFYINYTNNSGNTVVSRFSVSAGDPDVADVNSEMILTTITQPFSNHNGGCIQFGRDGYLYIGMGDGGSGGDPQNNGQSQTSLLGKVLRLDVDNGTPYGIPPSNPYLSSSIPDEIWAFGVRNPWRFSFDRLTGDLWMGDVGQNSWEEIDYLAYNSDPAPNFGWRCYEGNVPYNTSGCQPAGFYDPPIYVYSNSGPSGCSVTGGYIYRGGRYASLAGTYFHTDYCTGFLWETRSNGAGGFNTIQGNQYNQFDLVSLGEDVYGELYVLGISSGDIWRITDTTSAPIALILSDSSITVCDTAYELRAPGTPGMSFQWQLNGADIAGADTSVLWVNTAGAYTVIVGHGGISDTSSAVNVAFASPPVASFTGLDSFYCVAAANAPLTGLPAGGNFVGTGIVGNEFSPSIAGVGTHQVIYYYDAGGYGCTDTDTATTEVSICPGIAPADLLPGFSMYPVPANESMQFKFALEHAASIEWEVLDMNGRSLYAGQGEVLMGEFRQTLELAGTPAGLYMLRLRVGDVSYGKSFSVAH